MFLDISSILPLIEVDRFLDFIESKMGVGVNLEGTILTILCPEKKLIENCKRLVQSFIDDRHNLPLELLRREKSILFDLGPLSELVRGNEEHFIRTVMKKEGVDVEWGDSDTEFLISSSNEVILNNFLTLLENFKSDPDSFRTSSFIPSLDCSFDVTPLGSLLASHPEAFRVMYFDMPVRINHVKLRSDPPQVSFDFTSPNLSTQAVVSDTLSHYLQMPQSLENLLNERRRQQVHIFVDSSNILIEGKKCLRRFILQKQEEQRQQASPQYSLPETRYQLNVPKLLEIVSSMRQIRRTVVTGSVSHHSHMPSGPYKEDEFWGCWDTEEINITQRVELGGGGGGGRGRGRGAMKEQGSNEYLLGAFLQESTRNYSSSSSTHSPLSTTLSPTTPTFFSSISPSEHTLILLNGHGSFVDAVQHALTNGWKVEVWAWSRSVSRVYYEFEENYSEYFRLFFLDQFIEELIEIKEGSSPSPPSPPPPSLPLCRFGYNCTKFHLSHRNKYLHPHSPSTFSPPPSPRPPSPIPPSSTPPPRPPPPPPPRTLHNCRYHTLCTNFSPNHRQSFRHPPYVAPPCHFEENCTKLSDPTHCNKYSHYF